MAHARRKFFDLHTANQSQLAAQALDYIGELYAIEREAKLLHTRERWRLRQEKAKPIADKLHAWMLAQRSRVPDGSGTAKALDYSLKRWVALTRYLDDGAAPIDNNHIEQQIRPLAVGRNYAQLVIMHSCRSERWISRGASLEAAEHNNSYRDCRKASTLSVGRYRVWRVAGGAMAASAR